MTLDDMRALVLLAEERHFGRAAERMGLSQPALTKRVRQLEVRLGGPLFTRHARGAEPTAAGQGLIERARRLLDDATSMEQIARGMLSGELGVLRIGVGLSVMLSGLPRVFESFRARYPEVRLTVRDLSSDEQVRALEAGDLDVGFVRLGRQTRDLAVEPVLQEELRIACPEDRAPTGRSYKALLGEPLILTSKAASPTYHEHVLATCKAIGYAPPGIQEANQLLTVLLLVQAGMGISLVPASSKTLGVAKVRFLDARLPASHWQIAVAWNRKVALSQPGQRFLAMVRRRFATR